MGSISNSQRFSAAFLPPILLNQTQDDIKEALRQHCFLTELTQSMRQGNLTPDELLEVVEPYMPDMDSYADYVDGQLETLEEQWQL